MGLSGHAGSHVLHLPGADGLGQVGGNSLTLRSGLTWPLCPEIINYEFDTKDLVCLGLSSIVGVWYLLRKVSSQGLSRRGGWGDGRMGHSELVSLPPFSSTGLPTTSLAWPSPLMG